MSAPALAVTQPDGSRKYVHPATQETAPSVTTIIRMIAKPQLDGWKERKMAEYMVTHEKDLALLPLAERAEQIRSAPRIISDASADIGTAVHNAIDASAKGQPFQVTKETGSYLNSFAKFVMENKPRWIENEVTVWSRAYGYAGTADWIAEIGGHVYLGDTKCGRRVYEEVGLQTAALAGADFILREDGTEDPLPEIGFLAALHVRPRSYKFIPVSHREENFRAFLACREMYSWAHETAPSVLGEAA
jgi:hypothetical protein